MSGSFASSRGSIESSALALQRVLALEGRDVLSRVELAASELGRFGLAPVLAEQIGAIREAVGELDLLLDKIERLSDPHRRDRPAGAARIEPILAAVRDRVAPVLAARGVLLEAIGYRPLPSVAIPAAVLERLLLLWLRTAIAGLARGEDFDEESTICLGLEAREQDDAIELVLRPTASLRRLRFEIERTAQVELDVALAEWHGLAIRIVEGEQTWLALRLPASGRSGDV